MRVIRAGLPALIGTLILAFAVMPVLSGLQGGGRQDLVDRVLNACFPIAIGIGLLLVALALYRQLRLGLYAGMVVAALFVVAGLGILVLESSFLNSREFGGIFALPVMGVAAAWSTIWILYGWRLGKARSTFASAWQLGDRLLAVGLAVLVAASIGANVVFNALDESASVADAGDQLQAQALVDGTTLAVQVKEQTVDAAGGTVGYLKLALIVTADQKYALFNRPTLCLTDLATYQDPAYKSGNVCWGGDGTPISVMDDIGTPGLEAGPTAIDVDLTRGASRCPFPAGVWNAELTLTPRTGGAAVDPHAINVTFEVQPATVGETAAPPSSTGQEPSGCMASLVSK